MGKILAAGQPGAFLERLERILEKAAYEVFTAHDISSAANLLDKEILIDLIVLADFAGAEDNYLLLRNIRQDPVFKKIPVIIISERTERETVIGFLRLGVQNYLVQSNLEGKIVASAAKAIEQNNWRAKLCPNLNKLHASTNISSGIPLKRYRETLTALNWFLPKLSATLKNENFKQVNTAVRILGFLAKETGISVMNDLIVEFAMSNRAATREQAAHYLSRIEILRNLLVMLIGKGSLGAKPPFSPQSAPKQSEAVAPPSIQKRPVAKSIVLDQSGTEIFQAISRLNHLPVMEPVLSFIRDATSRGHLGLDDAVDYLKMEPGLCLQILSIANSTYVASKSSVNDISSALQLIGIGNLENILLKTRNITPFEKLFMSIDGQGFWAHQVGTARLCQRVNDLLDLPHYPEVYMAGLLHDVGKTVLAHLFPKEYNAVLARSRQEKILLTEAEAAFIEKQRLPGAVKTAVRFHRFPEKALSDVELTAIVNVANFLCKKVGVGCSGSSLLEDNNEILVQPGWKILRKYLHTGESEEEFADELIEQAAKLEQEVQLATLQLA